MKVELKISAEVEIPYAVVYCSELSDEVQRILSVFQTSESVITAADQNKIAVLKPEEIYMVRVENEKTILYGREKQFVCGKRLYELEKLLGKGFMRISKSTIIQLKRLESVEPSFNGMMLLMLSNGCKDYISRKYLPDLKKYLGI